MPRRRATPISIEQWSHRVSVQGPRVAVAESRRHPLFGRRRDYWIDIEVIQITLQPWPLSDQTCGNMRGKKRRQKNQ